MELKNILSNTAQVLGAEIFKWLSIMRRKEGRGEGYGQHALGFMIKLCRKPQLIFLLAVV